MISKIDEKNTVSKIQFLEEQIIQIYQKMNQAFTHGAPWTLEQFMADLNSTATNYLFLEVQAKLVGFVSYRQIIDEIEIDEVLIFKEFQHLGFGYQLMQKFLQEAFEKQGQTIFLEVRQSNLPAIALYEKCGFKQIAKRKNYYQHPVEDAWIYQYQRGD